MFDLFDLPVTHEGKELSFPAELMPMGFTHKIRVTVQGTDIVFEPDEERNYRATLTEADRDIIAKMDIHLLRAICHTLDELFGNGGSPSFQ